MTLNDILSITKFKETNNYIITACRQDGTTPEHSFMIDHATAPDYKGPFSSDCQRKSCRENKQYIKQYGGYEVIKIYVCGNTIRFDIVKGE